MREKTGSREERIRRDGMSKRDKCNNNTRKNTPGE